ncbi:uncharacterized oxidoreductase YjmC-like [Paramacrobiotus metropolitanus]|uniref:uncharacterized oxidoreductase YjmC-like n=1 Tax=Paramacrobiotus metropolitanus TaxID=2943436 RepID=UPI0024460BFD|nr:uncharacterized oxidoreductase YjmC-like [Paramacrobiotus metropolitanus]
MKTPVYWLPYLIFSTRKSSCRITCHLERAIAARNMATINQTDVSPSAATPIVVPSAEATSFIQRCMEKVGTHPEHARQLADVLVMGDHRGHFSHGLNRLDMYVRDIQSKTCNGDGVPVIVKESASTALIDGQNLLGPVVGRFAMAVAIRKAKESGVGWVAANASNHYGIAGYYGLQACKEGMIGMSFTNTSPFCVPTGGVYKTLGTNPICFAAPGVNGDDFVLDMATTTVAIGKVEIAMRKEQPVPSSWGLDKDGHESTDPEKIFHGGGLLPLGGAENTGGYKGYGLNVMVEILCGILSDAAFGPNIRSWTHPVGAANLGQGFVAIDPGRFADGFKERLQAFVNILRHLEPSDPSRPVQVAGDPERAHLRKCDSLGGIPYHVNQIRHAEELARQLGVAPMKTKE